MVKFDRGRGGYWNGIIRQTRSGWYNWEKVVQIFICNADGELLSKSNETNNIRWISLIKLKELLESNKGLFYPMHVITLEKYIKMKLKHN